MFKQTYKVTFILFLLLAVTVQSFCQVTSSREIDSLRVVLKKSNNTNIRSKALHGLGALFLERRPGTITPDLDTALTYFTSAYNLANKQDPEMPFGRLETLCRLGEVANAQHNIKKAGQYFKEVTDYYNVHHKPREEAVTWIRQARSAQLSYIENYPSAVANQIVNSYNQALQCYISCNAQNDEIMVYHYLGYTYSSLNQPEKAISICMQGINKYGKTYIPNMAGLYYTIAHLYRYQGNLPKALNFSLESIRVANNNSPAKAGPSQPHVLYGELAEIYDALGQTANSIIWYKKALALRENMPIKLNFIYRTAGFIASGLIKERKFAEALNIVLGVESRHPPTADFDKAVIAHQKALCYNALGRYNLAEALYVKAIKLFGNVKDNEIVSLAKHDAIKFFIKQKNFDKAAIYFNEDVVPTYAVLVKRDHYWIKYKIDSAKKDYPSALNSHVLYQTLSDSVFNVEKNKQIQQLQIQYETAQKEKDIQSLKKDSQLAHEKEKTATSTRNLTFVATALLIFALGLIYNGYMRKQRSNVALNKLVGEKDELISDKEWLLKEIHHRVKNNLQIAMGLLQRQSAYIDNDDALSAIHSSENRMRAIALIHQKLYQSDNLNLIFMPEYIEEMINHLKDSCGLDNRIFFERHMDNVYLDVAQAVPLGLIMNEAITNALKYAYAADAEGKIYITLIQEDNQCVHLTLADDGPGLPAHLDLEQVQSLGINLMRGLTKQLGGTFNISSNEGCMIEISFKAEVFKRDTSESKYL